MFKVNYKNTRTTSLTSFKCLYCKLQTYFRPFSTASIVDLKQVNFSWVVPSSEAKHAPHLRGHFLQKYSTKGSFCFKTVIMQKEEFLKKSFYKFLQIICNYV